ALQDGILFTRYLPDLAFGYGYPFFNYRAALSYYLALALHLTGLALPVALNGVYVLSILGSALTAYLLARDLFGPRAGIVAAVAYAYAPYQFLDALLRGNAPEAVALPLFPLILWAFRRLALTGQRRWFLTSVSSLAALLMTHNISSLLFSPLLLAYLIVLWLVYRQEGHWIAVGGAFALAFGLTAFFWGPALLERDYVQLHMSHVTRNNDFHYNFLGLAEIFAPPAPVDTSLMNPPMRVHLGLVQAVLAMVGLAVGMVRAREQRSGGAEEQGSKGAEEQGSRGTEEQGSRGTEEQGGRGTEERRATLIFFAASAAFFIFMGTRASLWLWEHVPLLPFVQFPWRFVGRATLPVALLASAPFYKPQLAIHHSQPAIRNPQSAIVHWSLVIVHCSLFILAALPSTYPPHGYCPSAPHPTISDVFAYEHRSKLVGVDPEGSYFPVWVKHRPEGSPLEERYSTGGPVARFDETVLPTGASVVEADYGPNRAHLVVETPVPFRARYLAFYFPGWRVTVNGDPVSIAPTEPEGLISFDVPAGRHTVAVRFGETPLRLVADAISLLSLVAGILVYWYTGKLVNSANHQVTNLPTYQPTNLPIYQSTNLPVYKSTILLALLLLTLKLAVVDRTDTPFRRPTLRPDTTLPSVKYPLSQPYADGLTLIGYNQNHTLLSADGTLRLDLYWTAYAQPAARYQTVAHLVGPDGLRWSLPDTFRPRGYADYPPTTTWSPGRYALDSHEIEPLPGTPPGTYDVVLTVFDQDTLAPLSVLNEQDQPAAPTLTLGQVTLTAPHRPVGPNGLDVHHRLNVVLGPLTLLGADFDR
ncbi:MAG: glycosyltransferase family 39 protein, partial [Anaerolineae bacterium]|nr:glycosyltransferase family 39 protein [Anaerolineae bacterium]